MSNGAPLIRPAVAADRVALVALLGQAFAGRAFREDFDVRFPHLFSDAAIGQHHLAIADGAILGCVGCYRFSARLHGAPLRMAGIGQVATVAAARGRGLMTHLLNAALDSAAGIDLFWLYGDRQRYARAGFAPGGQVIDGMTWDRYAPAAADPAGIRAVDLARDDRLIAAALAARPFALTQERSERQTMLAGKGVRGWTDGAACVLLDDTGKLAWAMHGGVEAIVRLVAHQVAARRALDATDSSVTVQADPDDAPALAAVRALAGTVTLRATASLRVGRLLPLLRAWGGAHPPPPGARLRPSTIDGGAAGCVRIECADGAWAIQEAESAEADLRVEGGAELAELVFGLVPPQAWNLPADDALRHLLPLRFAIPWCYSL